MAKKSSSGKRKSRKKSNNQGLKQKLLKIGLLSIGGVILLLFSLFGAVYIGLFGALPTDEELQNIKQSNASLIYSSDGKLIGKYFIQNRSSIRFDEIPQVVIDALIATEDSRFFEHNGIDFYSIPRVVIKTVILGDESAGGGSTISQQLIKNLYGRKSHGALSIPVNKLKENITALKVEEIYSKEEIISLYLNTVSFGENVFGIKAASERFFNKQPFDLTIPEAATLIGMLKANTSYNPRLHPDASMERRNVVLALMVKAGTLSPESFVDFSERSIELDYKRLVGNETPAPYFRAHVKNELERILSSTDRGDGTPFDLYRDGLKITLSVHSKLQSNAENAVESHLKELQKRFDSHWQGRKPWDDESEFLIREAKKSTRWRRLEESGRTLEEIEKIFNTPTRINVFTHHGYEVKNMSPMDSVAYHQMILQAGFIAIGAQSGRVLAYVGGVDYAHFPYDHVQSKRQVGSTFKPFVYASALEAGFEPCDLVENEPIIFSNYEDWSPQNSDGKYGGFYTVKGGLSKSVNTIAARLIAETGPNPPAELANRLGITRWPFHSSRGG